MPARCAGRFNPGLVRRCGGSGCLTVRRSATLRCPARRTTQHFPPSVSSGESMEQRRLRPGDILDDYCPRERRLTDHVVVAMLDDAVKQVRCSACDAEHPYKGAKVPARRRKAATPAALTEQVLEGLGRDAGGADAPRPVLIARPQPAQPRSRRAGRPAPGATAPAAAAAAPRHVAPPRVPLPPQAMASPPEVAVPPAAAFPTFAVPPPPPASSPAPAPLAPRPAADEDEGPIHRRLIRATLPRPEGQPPTRPIPEFTMRQPGARGAAPARGGFRGAGSQGGTGRFAGKGSAWPGVGKGGRAPFANGNRASASAFARSDAHRSYKGGHPAASQSRHKKTR